MASTRAQYFSHVSKRFAFKSPFRYAQNALDLAAAEEDSRHAIDPGMQRLRQVITGAKGAMATMLWMLLCSGGRAKDITRLKRRDVAIDLKKGKRHIRIMWRITKQRRKRGKRVTTIMKLAWSMLPTIEVLNHLSDLAPNDRLVGEVNTASANEWLKNNSKAIEGRHMTTNSFRRHVINRVIDACDGDVEQAKKHTGHLSSATLMAFYQQWKEQS
jgi:hypothetical protein